MKVRFFFQAMLILSMIFTLLSNAVNSRRDVSILYNRIAILILIYCIYIDMNSLNIITKGIGLHGGLLLVNNITQIFHIFIYLISALILTLTSLNKWATLSVRSILGESRRHATLFTKQGFRRWCGLSKSSGFVVLVHELLNNETRGTGIRCAWSAVHGQSPSPSVKGDINPSDNLGGHSSSYTLFEMPELSECCRRRVPGIVFGQWHCRCDRTRWLAIGTVSTRSSLWTVRSTLGAIANEVIVPVSCYLDLPDPFCLTVKGTDLGIDVLRRDGDDYSLSQNYGKILKGTDGWKMLRVGILDPEAWRYDSSLETPVPEAIKQMVSLFKRWCR